MTVPVRCQVRVSKSDDWVRTIGRRDHIAYISLDELKPNNEVDQKPALTLNEVKLKPSEFYDNWQWSPDKCWAGSVLKEGVRAYCLPYARLGQHYPSYRDPAVKAFSPIGPCAGIYVWYIPRQNSFYLWGICWNVSGVLGPFAGDPRVNLPMAVKARKGQREFPGVRLSIISQRWLFPDANDARVPHDGFYDDSSRNSMSGRWIEMLRLNTFITHLRLVNNGDIDIYYQTERAGSDKPAICTLFNPFQESGDQALKTDYGCDIGGDTWKKLRRGGTVDFELRNQAFAAGVARFALLLNNEPNYWDPSKLLGTYPVMYGRH
jgi:hypothetical protein